MKRHWIILFSGFLFALGLGVSEMTRPEKVLGFLDVFGAWDPSLAFVMGGAIAVYAGALWLVRRRTRPVCGTKFHLPQSNKVDGRLLLGAAVFGVGWGLAGFCPGPALVGAATGMTAALYFVPALVGGILLHRVLVEQRT